MNDPKQLAQALKVLSVETRIRMVQLLKARPLCVNALAVRLGITPGAVSQHLRIMRAAGLVIDEKRGYYVHYRLNEETLIAWREVVEQLLTPDQARMAKDAS
jgi:DNA-binding transcriptional ArsR family regulator